MIQNVFQTGNCVVIPLHRETLGYPNLCKGAEVEIDLNREIHQLILKHKDNPLAIRDGAKIHACQVNEFIEPY